MSNGTNDRQNDTLDTMDETKSGAAAAGKKSSERGFYAVMLLIISGAAFYIYQDASKRYNNGLSSSNMPAATAESPAHPASSTSQPQTHTFQSTQAPAENSVSTRAVTADTEAETLDLEDKISNKISSIVKKVRDFVTTGSHEAEINETTNENPVTESDRASGTVLQPPQSKSPQATITRQPEVPAVQVQSVIEEESISISTDTGKPVMEEESFREKVGKIVEKVNELVHFDKKPVETTKPASSAAINYQNPPVSDYQPYEPSYSAYARPAYQGYNMPPPAYGSGPGYNNYRNYRNYGDDRNNAGAYDSYPQRTYQPSGYGYNSNPHYNNSYYNEGYGNPYPANSRYQPRPGY